MDPRCEFGRLDEDEVYSLWVIFLQGKKGGALKRTLALVGRGKEVGS